MFSTIGLGKDKCDLRSGDTPAPSHPWGRGGMGVVVLPALPQPRPALRLPASPQSCALLNQKPGLVQGVCLLLMLETESPGSSSGRGSVPESRKQFRLGRGHWKDWEVLGECGHGWGWQAQEGGGLRPATPPRTGRDVEGREQRGTEESPQHGWSLGVERHSGPGTSLLYLPISLLTWDPRCPHLCVRPLLTPLSPGQPARDRLHEDVCVLLPTRFPTFPHTRQGVSFSLRFIHPPVTPSDDCGGPQGPLLSLASVTPGCLPSHTSLHVGPPLGLLAPSSTHHGALGSHSSPGHTLLPSSFPELWVLSRSRGLGLGLLGMTPANAESHSSVLAMSLPQHLNLTRKHWVRKKCLCPKLKN